MSLAEVAVRPPETLTEFTIPIDPTGEDPPDGLVFATQAQLDAWLADVSASAIKTLEGAWYALPNYINHQITFELSTGVHRPRQAGEQGGFLLDGKTMSSIGVDINVEGVAPSSWTEEEAVETISSFSNSGNNPYMDFPATTYPADGSLKGLFAVLDTGQVTVIHDHSDSRLEVMHQLSPAPTSVTVMRPATILQNSLDGAAKAGTIAGVYARNQGVRAFSPVHFQNILFEAFGAYYSSLGDGQPTKYTQCMVDVPREFASHGLTGSDNTGGLGGFGEYCSNWTCSVLGPKFGGRTPTGTAFPVLQNGYLTGCYLNGFSVGNATGRDLLLQTSSVVFENMNSRSVFIDREGSFEPQEFFPHRRTTIRNGPGISLEGASLFRADTAAKIWFEGVTNACVRLGDRCHLMNENANLDLADGPLGGNTDVGIEFRSFAVRSAVCLKGTVTVSGTVGDVRMSDGSLKTYAEIAAPGISDARENFIIKD